MCLIYLVLEQYPIDLVLVTCRALCKNFHR